MEKRLSRPYFNFFFGLTGGLFLQINTYLFFIFILVPFVILFGNSHNWKREVKEIIEEEKQDMRKDSWQWLVSFIALLSGIATARLIGWYFLPESF